MTAIHQGLIGLSVKSVATLFVLVFIVSCSQPTLDPVPVDGRILAFGDSLTLGVGASAKNSYPAVLEQLTQRTVVNGGVSGETTGQGLTRLSAAIADSQPDLVILLEGGNDILRNIDYAEIKQNLAAMIDLIHDSGAQVVLIGVPEKRLFSDVAPFYRDLAGEYQLVFDDELIAKLLRNASYKSDPIHFNDAGYHMMASAIHQRLIRNGAL